jgi:hypothetical protein
MLPFQIPGTAYNYGLHLVSPLRYIVEGQMRPAKAKIMIINKINPRPPLGK